MLLSILHIIFHTNEIAGKGKKSQEISDC